MNECVLKVYKDAIPETSSDSIKIYARIPMCLKYFTSVEFCDFTRFRVQIFHFAINNENDGKKWCICIYIYTRYSDNIDTILFFYSFKKNTELHVRIMQKSICLIFHKTYYYIPDFVNIILCDKLSRPYISSLIRRSVSLARHKANK